MTEIEDDARRQESFFFFFFSGGWIRWKWWVHKDPPGNRNAATLRRRHRDGHAQRTVGEKTLRLGAPLPVAPNRIAQFLLVLFGSHDADGGGRCHCARKQSGLGFVLWKHMCNHDHKGN